MLKNQLPIKIVYVSNTPRRIDIPFYRSVGKITINACNFNRQIMEGFIKQHVDVTAIFSSIKNKEIHSNAVFLNEDDIRYLYIPKQSFFSKYRILKHYIKSQTKLCRIIIVCDVLNIRNTIPILVISKKLKILSVGIVTDLFRFFHNKGSWNIVSYLYTLIGNFSLQLYDSYVLLSEAMKDEAFVVKKKFSIIPGVYSDPCPNVKSFGIRKKTVVYSGSLDPKYGIENLVRAFNKLNSSYELHIYSFENPRVELINILGKKCVFKGYVDRKDLHAIQKTSSFLVNPREVSLDFNIFSFPSKLIEYLGSGTPILTTHLPSITPDFDRYFNYFTGDDESSIFSTLDLYLNRTSYFELEQKAILGRQYASQELSNIAFAKKIIDLAQHSEMR